MPNLNNLTVPQELLVVGAALKGGVFESLYEKPATLEALVKDLAMDSRAAWTVVEALISLGYIKRKDEVLELTPEAVQLFFDETSEHYIGYSLIHTFNVIRSWTNLPEILKTGQPP
ncbi:MAG: methyltransferase, partial [Negativicutes bacterium]